MQPEPRLGGGDEHVPRIDVDRLGELAPRGATSRDPELVALGGDEHRGEPTRGEERHHPAIEVPHPATDVDEQHEAAQVLALLDVALDHRRKALPHRASCGREPVAGQVAEPQRQLVVSRPAQREGEEVEQLGATGRPRDPGESSLSAQRVEQARLAHVGAACDREFGEVGLGALAHVGRALLERRREHMPAVCGSLGHGR